jgi:D-alanine transaminase
MNDSICYLNANWMPLSEAHIPVLDRGFIFGDGIYEVVPIYQGKPFRLAQHLTRLKRSLEKLTITNPHTDEQWIALVNDLAKRNPWPNQFVYIQVTRGVAKRDHAFPKTPVTPTVFAMVNELIEPAGEVLTKGVSAISLPDERWLHCDIKSVSLLGNVLAKQAAVEANAFECIMFRDDYLTEGSSANIWVVKDGCVMSAPKDHLVLEGIRYGLLQELCEEAGLRYELRRITRAEVLNADELLLTSATKEVLPITTLDQQPVGHGEYRGLPGPASKKLFAAYQKAKHGALNG